jgi:hypothetical protein
LTAALRGTRDGRRTPTAPCRALGFALPMRRSLPLVLFGALLSGSSASTTPTGPPAEPVSTWVYAHSFGGATLGERISAAIAALPETGGVVDATDFVGPQRIDQTIAVGSATKPVELRLGNVAISTSVIPFELHGSAKLIGNDLTLVTQDNGANVEWLITGTGLTNCEIAHLTIDGNRDANTQPGSGIGLHTAARCWVHNVLVRNTVGSLHPGIAFFDDGNSDNTIEHNQVENIGTLPNYADGIYVAGPGNKILFNRIRNATDFGIVGETCAGCIIEGNDISGTPAGIAIGSGIAPFTSVGNVVANNTITGGSTTTWGIISVYRTGGSSLVSTVVQGNVVRNVDNGHGIFISDADQVSVTGNVLTSIAPSTESYGIFVKDSRDVSIVGGTIDSTGGYGIGIARSSNVAVDGVVITDTGRSSYYWAGIALDALAGNSTSISFTNLHIFDRDQNIGTKRMSYCIDLAQGGTSSGIVVGGNLYDDGVNAVGCRNGNLHVGNALRVTTY